MADELERRLEAAGRASPPPLTDDRLGAIEDRVMAVTAEPVEMRRRMPLLAVAAALVAVLVVGIALVSARADDTRLELADGVVLEVPGEAPEIGVAGDDLPDGTVLTVDVDGAAVVDGRRFGPGRYLVVDGEVVPMPPPSTSSPGADDTAASSTGPSPPSTGDAATPVAPPPTTTATPVAPPVPPSRTTTTTVAVDRPVDRPPTDGTRPDRPTTTRPSDRPTTTERRPGTTRPRPTTTTTTTTTTTVPRDRPTTTTPRGDTTTTVRDAAPGDRG